ncbi:MAG: hypothetical protein ACJ8C3_08565, partial [Microvirga sp.]
RCKKVRTIALMTHERPPTFPDIPTTKEAGIDWTYQNWFARGPEGHPPGPPPEAVRGGAEGDGPPECLGGHEGARHHARLGQA